MSQPSIGSFQSKVWGHTQLAFGVPGMEAHVISVKRGGYCSRHRHEWKWNRFLVLEGELIVRLYTEHDKADETLVGPGQVSDVPPRTWHQFEAKTDVLAVEFYWLPSVDPEDIERQDHGGMKK